MEAERIIAAGRQALAQSRDALDVVAEAWQAQALAQAVGTRLALYGPQELRGEARGLSEAGGRGGLGDPPLLRVVLRAAQLTDVPDPRRALTLLSNLLGEVGIALVGVACATDDEGLYWQCIEAIDAMDESNDRVRAMLRRLSVRDREGERDRNRDGERAHGRAGPDPATSPP